MIHFSEVCSWSSIYVIEHHLRCLFGRPASLDGVATVVDDDGLLLFKIKIRHFSLDLSPSFVVVVLGKNRQFNTNAKPSLGSEILRAAIFEIHNLLCCGDVEEGCDGIVDRHWANLVIAIFGDDFGGDVAQGRPGDGLALPGVFLFQTR